MNIFRNVCHHEKRTDLKVSHVGSETWSLGQILEKSCVLSSKHSFDPICMKLCQNVWPHEMSDKIETGSSQVRSKSISFDESLDLHSNLYSNLFRTFLKCLFV